MTGRATMSLEGRQDSGETRRWSEQGGSERNGRPGMPVALGFWVPNSGSWCLQLDELQSQLQKKLLGGGPAASPKPSARSAASNAVTYTSAGSGSGHAGHDGGFSYSDSMPVGDAGGAPTLGADRRRGGSGRVSGAGAYQRADASASAASVSAGSWDGLGGSQSSGQRHGSSSQHGASVPLRHGGDSLRNSDWRQGIEFEPSPARAFAASQQQMASRSGARAAAAAVAARQTQRNALQGRRQLVSVQLLPALQLCRIVLL